MEQLRYPIGRYQFEGMNPAQREKWMTQIEQLPAQLRAALDGLTEEQLDTPYRTGGWTIRQVTHHLADAGMNCFTRFKLALTESNPTIKPFDESLWAETPDSLKASPEISLAMIEALYARWSLLLRSMERSQFDREFYHPERGSQLKLSYFLGFVAWHGRHHLSHITNLRERMDW
ncbi:putative metal-dependent hydrolase [Paenibacillus sp. LHD-117]|uniref:YfiT family bacillithiol transferase n=1 Tax=Paenibacillus sp. LHD-117 TaxID=3071412 RepID=UPI0027E180D6|nr:putative metal-dependent hydrolase [Paenibacillus sp. LHD-117]MDQ6420834.1 putative metal-dependent hydrolase [Paenibacillus sp. LHD-117]